MNSSYYNKLVLFIPFLVSLVIIYFFSVGIFYQDEWNLSLFFSQMDMGNYSSIWSLHNEHRLVLPKIIFYLNNSLGFSTSTIMYLSQILQFFTFLLIVYGINQQESIYGNNKSNLIILFTGLFIFSIVQSDNILWGFQIQWYLCLLGTIIFIYGITQYRYFITLTGLIIAYLSFSNWVILIPLVFIHIAYCIFIFRQYNWVKFYFHFSLILFMIMILFLYLYNGASDKGGLIGKLISSPFGFLEYFLAILGGPFSVNLLSSKILGFIFLVITLFLLIKNYQDKKLKSFSILIIIWLIISSALISLARFEHGAIQALVPRFYTFTLIGWAVLLYSLFNLYFNNKLFKKAILAFAFILISISYAKGFLLINEDFRVKKAGLDCYRAKFIKKGSEDSNCLKLLFPSPDYLSKMHIVLEKLDRIPENWKSKLYKRPELIIQLNNNVESILDYFNIPKSYKFNSKGTRQ